MSLLWDKGGAAPDAKVQRFLAGDDVLLDRALLPYDLAASRAHVEGLGRIGVLTDDEVRAIAGALDELSVAFASGAFVLDAAHEDCHSAIEAVLVEKLGDVGRKVHTGRSRNDQVLTALRMLQRDALSTLDARLRAAARALLERALADPATPIPGYTHLQRAVPSSVGVWLGGYVEAFLDDAEYARATRRFIDRCPLGTAAGYGVNLPLDRAGVAHALGFAEVQWNPVYAQNSRGKFELAVLSAFAQALLDLRRLAWDLSLYTSSEFGFVRLPERHTTGSSIMPQKRNPDVVELLRAAYAVTDGAASEIAATLSLPAGYHRDLQAQKAPLLRALDHGLAALDLLPDLVRGLELDHARMRAAITPELHATDRAIELAQGGMPFRTAYRKVADEPAALAGRTPEDSLRARTSPGAAGDPQLDRLRLRLDALDADAIR